MSIILGDILTFGGGTGNEDIWAAISVTYPYGSICTATNGTTTLTASDASGQVVFGIAGPISTPETWTVSCTYGDNSDAMTVDIEDYGQVEYVELIYTPIKSFGTATDEEFSTMIRSAHAGKIDLHNDANWNVGDVRTIHINAFTGGGNVSHAAQDIDIVIGSFSDYENCGCVLQFDFKDSLATGNRLNNSNFNTGGYGGSKMYGTTLPALVNALPTYLKNLLIEFNCKSSAGDTSSTINTVSGNKLALRSEIEIFGSVTYSKQGEGSQIPYYTNTNNRKKKLGHSGSIGTWWERSPSGPSAYSFCYVDANGGVSYHGSSNADGVAPFGCI